MAAVRRVRVESSAGEDGSGSVVTRSKADDRESLAQGWGSRFPRRLTHRVKPEKRKQPDASVEGRPPPQTAQTWVCEAAQDRALDVIARCLFRVASLGSRLATDAAASARGK